MDLKSIEYVDWDSSKVVEYGKSMPSIFGFNSCVDKSAYLNWRMRFGNSRRKFIVIGEAYFSSAYNLIQQCLIDNEDKKADSWIFPILFNVVHGIEVYLKAINASLSCILRKEKTEIERGHDIKQLCNGAKKLINEYKTSNKCGTTEDMFAAIKVVEQFVANIYEKTNDMTFARYPMAKDRDGHFYVQTFENEVVDLERMCEQVVIVYKLLDFIFEMPEMDIELQNKEMEECF